MTIPVSNPYYTTSDWIAAVDGDDGYRWRDTTVTVNGNAISDLWAPSYSWSLVARDYAAAVGGAGFSWRMAFSTTTTDADPGAGLIRADSATVASVTELYVDDLGADGADYSAVMALFDDSTSTVKGQISLVNIADNTDWFRAEVTGVTDNSGYFTIAVQNPTGSGASVPFAAAAELAFGFTRNGDKGDTGSSGASGFDWVTKTGAYTAVKDDRILADTSGGAFTVTLPATPSSGHQVAFADPGSNWATNNLTVAGNGNNIDGASTFAADADEGYFAAVYNGTQWEVRSAGGSV